MLETITLKIGKIKKSLGVFFDERATFGYHIESMFIRASRKLEALTRIAQYTNLSKTKSLMDVFFNFQFIYCYFVCIAVH